MASTTLENKKTFAIHPQKFGLWIGIVSITMMFAAFTSAYLVKRADTGWLLFDLPMMFYWSSVVILISSFTMHFSLLSARKDNIQNVKAGLIITFILGCVFLFMQVRGWNELVEGGVFFAGATSNPAGSFVYVISGLHAFHIISGLVVLLIILYLASRYKVHSKNTHWIDLCATYWHFLDVLWIYLFVFMLLNR